MKAEHIKIDFIPEAMPNQVVRFINGRYGVYDSERKQNMAYGMDKMQAAEWAHRRNYKHAWGV